MVVVVVHAFHPSLQEAEVGVGDLHLVGSVD